MGKKSKGADKERELANLFRDNDWFSTRIGSSGSATSAELPDLIAAKDGNVIVTELKYTSSDIAYYKEDKIDGLIWLAEEIDAKPYLSVRFKHDKTFYAIPPEMSSRTDDDNYRISKEEAKQFDFKLPPKQDK